MSLRGPGVSPRAFALAVAVVLAVVVGGVIAAEAGDDAAVNAAEAGDDAAVNAAEAGDDAAGPDGPPLDGEAAPDDGIAPDPYDPDPPTDDGTAVVVSDGERTTFDAIAPALDAAAPGDTVELRGEFRPDAPVVVDEPNVTVRASDTHEARIDGGGEGTVLVADAPNVTVEGLWLAESGDDLEAEDAGVLVGGDADGATLAELYLTDVTFGVWVDGADEVTVRDSRIEGTEAPRFADRGNGIHLWETTDTEVRNNEITAARDGIYYSWAEGVDARNNTMWNLRFGVHYMYSNDNTLADNVAYDNDVGYALMVSEGIEVVNNTAVANRGESGHGILLKEIDDTVVRGNTLVANDRGAFLYNAQDNALRDNLVYANGVGVHHSAGTEDTTVVANSFVHNEEAVVTTIRDRRAWNGSEAGNYWSDARAVDADGDGVSETRHRPAGAVERLVNDVPAAAVFADSPAFDAIRLVESRFPVVETAGVVDHRPLADPPHDPEPYRPYAAAVDPTVEYDDDPGDDHHHH